MPLHGAKYECLCLTGRDMRIAMIHRLELLTHQKHQKLHEGQYSAAAP
jgi:hypothetical protein